MLNKLYMHSLKWSPSTPTSSWILVWIASNLIKSLVTVLFSQDSQICFQKSSKSFYEICLLFSNKKLNWNSNEKWCDKDSYLYIYSKLQIKNTSFETQVYLKNIMSPSKPASIGFDVLPVYIYLEFVLHLFSCKYIYTCLYINLYLITLTFPGF